MYVYLITNKINNMKYVGQTIQNINERWKQHCRKSTCRRLSNAIKKYGKENFNIEMIEECNSIEKLNAKEKYWIKKLNTLSPNGYNLMTGGNNSLPSLETRKILSEKSKGANNGFYGKHHNEETKTKMKLNHKDVNGSNNPMYMHKRTQDEIMKIKSNMNKPFLIYCFENNKTYLSLQKVSDELNVDKSQVAKVCKNILHSAKGYHFKYINYKVMEG